MGATAPHSTVLSPTEKAIGVEFRRRTLLPRDDVLVSELRLAEGKLTMVLAIDRVSKFTYVEFRDDAGTMNGADFLRGMVSALPLRHLHRADRQR